MSDATPTDLARACADLAAGPAVPLAVIDVDEVLALFIQGFDRFLRAHGHELRMTSFALFSNLYAAGAAEPADRIVAKGLFDGFFAEGCHEVDPSPDAAASLAEVSKAARVVILTNAPESARRLRGEWLKTHGLDYPLVINSGLKGPAVRALADAARGPTAFVDDLLSNLDSVADSAPTVHRFQMVADPALRVFAPSSPRHRRVDDWCTLAGELRRVLSPSPLRGGVGVGVRAPTSDVEPTPPHPGPLPARGRG